LKGAYLGAQVVDLVLQMLRVHVVHVVHVVVDIVRSRIIKAVQRCRRNYKKHDEGQQKQRPENMPTIG